MKEKYTFALVIAIIINTITLVISNILEVKSTYFFGTNLSISLGSILYPIIYLTSDVIQEFGGYKLSRQTSYIGLIIQLVVVLIFQLLIYIIPNEESVWVQESLQNVFGAIPALIVTSLFCAWLGDLINDKVFLIIQNKNNDTTSKSYAKRAYISSIAGKIFDSGLFAIIAFWFFPNFQKFLNVTWITPMESWSFSSAFICATFGLFVGIVVELILLPISIKIVNYIRKENLM
ncbi:MAG: queuosine precursor transporter [Rickettsiales bacterium]|jgi:uncharacterized integral membrane protein (TIGR00697 family)|nr:queuosine precursor transporter [Rickettsiales bacterium]